MADESHLDNKYFIDGSIYNCPYCKRGHVSYTGIDQTEFDWNDSKCCYIYITQCSSCGNRSMHMSFEDIETKSSGPGFSSEYEFNNGEDEDLDSKFFYSVPTSFFSLDVRIPKILRILFVEAEGCLKSNYLTGASACVRKIIYELAILGNATGVNYDERIKSLKRIRKDIEPEYFDTLLTIQKMTSDKVHEDSYDGWENRHLKLLLSTLSEILILMYVIPEVRKEKRKAIVELHNSIINGKTKK